MRNDNTGNDDNTSSTPRTHSNARVHIGRMILLAAGKYPSLLTVLYEIFQNGIDASATNIRAGINLQTREITVTDDGEGTSKEQFDLALAQVGQSMKREGKLGRFGLGLVSPLGKCARFTFTSGAKGGPAEGYMEWSFITADIEKSATDVKIPFRFLRGTLFSQRMRSAPAGMMYVPWRTKVYMQGVTTDSVVSRLDLDSLAEGILDKYGIVILRNRVNVHIEFTDANGKVTQRDVKPRQFQGRKLPEAHIENADCGFAQLNLYIATKSDKGRRGKVRFGVIGDDFRLTARQFANSVRRLLEPEIVNDAILSGIFEGDMLGQKIQLHPSRTAFLKDDTLLGFCVAITEWWEKTGAALVKELKDEQRDARIQEIGRRSMTALERMMGDERWKDLFQPFRTQTVTADGHKIIIRDPPRLDPPAKSDPPVCPPNGSSGGGTKPDQDNVIVRGPRGERRRIVRSEQAGLRLEFVDFPSSREIYRLDPAQSLLEVNTRHQFWFDCEANDRALAEYIEAAAITAFALLPHEGGASFEERQTTALDLLGIQVYAILHRHTATKKAEPEADGE